MIFGILNLIYAKDSNNWRILEIKITPVNKITGLFWKFLSGAKNFPRYRRESFRVIFFKRTRLESHTSGFQSKRYLPNTLYALLANVFIQFY